MGFLGDIISGAFGQDAQSSEHRWQQQMWNMSNEYNDPRNQISRLVNSGITPAAAMASITGQGAQGAASFGSGGMPSMPSTEGSSSQAAEILGLLKTKKENIEADTEQKQTQAGRNRRMTDSEVEKNKAETDKFISEASKNYQETRNLRLFRDLLYRKNEVEIQKMSNEINQITKNIEYLDSLIGKIGFEKGVMSSQVKINKKLRELYDAEIKQKLEDAGMMHTQAALNKINGLKSVYEIKKVLTEAFVNDMKGFFLRNGINADNILGQLLMPLNLMFNANTNIKMENNQRSMLYQIEGLINSVLEGFDSEGNLGKMFDGSR